jgi:hypothetical protein
MLLLLFYFFVDVNTSASSSSASSSSSSSSLSSLSSPSFSLRLPAFQIQKPLNFSPSFTTKYIKQGAVICPPPSEYDEIKATLIPVSKCLYYYRSILAEVQIGRLISGDSLQIMVTKLINFNSYPNHVDEQLVSCFKLCGQILHMIYGYIYEVYPITTLKKTLRI